MSADIEKHADKAWDTFVDVMSGGAISGGTWPDFFSLLGPELDFIWPYPPNVGHYTGMAGRQKAEEIFSQMGGPEFRMTGPNTIGRTVGTDRVVYEDHSTGVVQGQPYEGRHCIHFIVAGDKIVGFHEYHAPVVNPA